ncbi:MAG: glycosyltransferase family protein [Chloroflexota bacterium]
MLSQRTPTIAIIQARMSSSRLPGKVLLDIAGEPMLAWVLSRTRQARRVDQVVVATTTEPSDDPIAEYCARQAVPCYRGSLHDVLDRYYQAARAFGADSIIRITADCPLIDPVVIDQTVQAFRGETDESIRARELGIKGFASTLDTQTQATPYDFVANRLPPPWGRTFPIGMDVEVCTFEALETAWKEAGQPHQREHVMPFFYDHPERFRMLLVDYKDDFGALRWTVDTPQDLQLVRQLVAHFPGRQDFSWLEVLQVFQSQPDLAQINASVQHKDYRQVDERRSDKK